MPSSPPPDSGLVSFPDQSRPPRNCCRWGKCRRSRWSSKRRSAPGIETIVIVNHPSKTPVEQYFDPAPDLLDDAGAGRQARAGGTLAPPRQTRRAVRPPGDRSASVTPSVWPARWSATSRSPCCCPTRSWATPISSPRCSMAAAQIGWLGDCCQGSAPRAGQLLWRGRSVGPDCAGRLLPVGDLVEKPPVDRRPSDYIIIGRYVLLGRGDDRDRPVDSRRRRRVAAHRRAARRYAGYQPFHCSRRRRAARRPRPLRHRQPGRLARSGHRDFARRSPSSARRCAS